MEILTSVWEIVDNWQSIDQSLRELPSVRSLVAPSWCNIFFVVNINGKSKVHPPPKTF